MTTPKIDPTSIRMNRPAGWEGFVPTKSGSGFHPLAPQVGEVHLSDIAYGLAYRFRYGCQTTPYTVAEHCVLVSKIIEILWPEVRPVGGLMHDGCEAYTHDIPSPVRSKVSVKLPDQSVVSWVEMEHRISKVIEVALGLPAGCTDTPEVRAADMLAVTIEKAQIPELADLGSWGLPKLPEALQGLRVEFLTPEQARLAFLDRYASLRATEGR